MSRLTLKNIKVINGASRETLFHTATMYWDGKKVGECSNEGQGGPTYHHFDNREVEKEVLAWADTQDLEYDFEKLGQITDALVVEHESAKWVKRQTRNKVLFRVEGDDEGAYRQVKVTRPQLRGQAVIYIKQQYGDRVVEMLGADRS